MNRFEQKKSPPISRLEMDDIVFAGRNKNYGAYLLRRRYTHHMSRAIIIAILLILFFLFWPQIVSFWDSEEPLKESDLLMREVSIGTPNFDIPEPSGSKTKSSEKPKSIPPKTLVKKDKNFSASSTPKVVKEETPPIEESSKDTGLNSGKEESPGQAGEGTGTEEVFRYVSHMPLFPGCEQLDISYAERRKCAEKSLRDFLRTNLRYPNLAVQNKTEGTVMVQFIVEKNGTVSNIKILQDIGDGCGQEARRVIELMNGMNRKWTPGLQGQTAVRVQYTLPVVFTAR
ncbi:MAG: TonB family protein [Saprospiraceae bacterium]|nr:TonB family protein [Candidatus Vicinibacter proximus]MBL7822005.1 TonB family protein [Saprospiraceae bacterium]MCC6842900.1 TonB family protein [Saprospiraceae bacterium]HRG33975.1 TonB family protein [Saprospiraceae bacterium]